MRCWHLLVKTESNLRVKHCFLLQRLSIYHHKFFHIQRTSYNEVQHYFKMCVVMYSYITKLMNWCPKQGEYQYKLPWCDVFVRFVFLSGNPDGWCCRGDLQVSDLTLLEGKMEKGSSFPSFLLEVQLISVGNFERETASCRYELRHHTYRSLRSTTQRWWITPNSVYINVSQQICFVP